VPVVGNSIDVFKRLKNLRALGKNKYEIYVSFVFVSLSFLLSFLLHRESSRYEGSLITTGLSLIGFICAVNAVEDADRMNTIERIMANIWFFIAGVVLCMNLLTALMALSFVL
jgi:peptidoglycan/LPS O-acetylase OafA/YrhL